MLKNSFIELNGRQRAIALLDIGSFREVLGPFDRIESPHLAAQGIVPQSDDGVIIGKGAFKHQPAVIISIEGAFQGGGIGEVGGSKIAGALEHVLKENKIGKKIIPVIIFDTGGVRLQEANYGLLMISEIQSAIVALREYGPVIGLIPGNVGSFGGMSITAALCSELIMTETARFGLNGPEVIEQEAGITEFNSKNRALVWNTIGGMARYEMGLVDQLVEDDVELFRNAIHTAISKEFSVPRTQQISKFLSTVNQLDPTVKNRKESVLQLLENKMTQVPDRIDAKTPSRGRTWFTTFTKGVESISKYPTVLVADREFEGKMTRFVAIVPNEKNRFPRAIHGEVGLQEGWVLAKYIREAIEDDADKMIKRNFVAIIDVPSQAYGFNEELLGIHYACAASADAYATARLKGHSVIGVIVGNAISGAFLAHGLQSSRLIALNDKDINVQAMSKQSAARITKRTIAELEEVTKKVPAMAYDINSYYTLGALDTLIDVENANFPTTHDFEKVSIELSKAIEANDHSLSQRLKTKNAVESGRKSSIVVRSKIEEQWN
ncbi:biotin-independent malonate decarboxylase subunit beta [Chryseobacterium sp. JAH]|uniref:biotin-independent malonate decarboxylase subunit beta n=1 Tax=Chryseobacterium sp. JAH TaxID=1742858 RepID=UPI000740E5F2|nr:biotin-independent malonate decarboxylase subunit beta [Chryseobacterium sp. JAH]KUJ50020.1 malonate decarboxylase subunit beta [Chryseobacterium sp. JAH]